MCTDITTRPGYAGSAEMPLREVHREWRFSLPPASVPAGPRVFCGHSRVIRRGIGGSLVDDFWGVDWINDSNEWIILFSLEISQNFAKISPNLWKSRELLETLVNCKCREFQVIFINIRFKAANTSETCFFWDVEVWAMQRCVNHADIEKYYAMSTCTQLHKKMGTNVLRTGRQFSKTIKAQKANKEHVIRPKQYPKWFFS